MANEPADRMPSLSVAEGVLSRAFGGTPRLDVEEMLRPRGRNRVARCRVVGGPPGAPATVIVKSPVDGEGERAHDPMHDIRESAAWRFYNEWASTRFLNGLGGESPPCARLFGGDTSAALLVLEDLGAGASLADVLEGDDGGAAQEALLSYATSMGRLHALTIGGETQWRNLRNAAGGVEAAREREGGHWLEENVARFGAHCEALGVVLAPGFGEEAAAIQESLADPGPFLAFSPGDTCPDNHRIVPGGRVRFFDFEFGGFRHALLDAAYFHAPFPTCWCVNRLPGDLAAGMEAAYRGELSRGCPEAGNDELFGTAMSHACAYWAIATLGWGLEGVLAEDQRWGISTVRQRHLLRLENFAERAERLGHLPAMAGTARALAAKLETLWPEVPAMPLYPPLRAAAGKDGP